MSFSKDFVWGAAAASYQIEGAWDADGKGLSVWDMFTRQPGKIWEGDTGNIACDHYHRYRDDVAMMSDLGLKAYRLSITWSRVLPDGNVTVNKAGLDFYDQLVDELLTHNIDPWVTLFHWDYPYGLFLRGGWLNPESPQWFADYTRLIVDRLSDRVTHWITLNEPQCFIGMGHLTGEHAPGLMLGMREVLLAGHHSLLAHGRSVEVIRSRAKRPAKIGWAPVGISFYPKTESPADIAAARERATAVKGSNLWSNTWWADPPLLGHYPEEGLRAYGHSAPKIKPDEMKIIHQPLDFYGCNIYSGAAVEADEHGNPRELGFPSGHPHTQFFWKVAPEAVYWVPKFLSERYKLPIVITENGLSSHDWVSVDGQVHDHSRIDFLTRYLRQVERAIKDGIDIRGYFHWSIMDNFEWAEGYKHRFGLVHVDYETQRRTLKDSALWYSEIIRTNGASLHHRKPAPAREPILTDSLVAG